MGDMLSVQEALSQAAQLLKMRSNIKEPVTFGLELLVAVRDIGIVRVSAMLSSDGIWEWQYRCMEPANTTGKPTGLIP